MSTPSSNRTQPPTIQSAARIRALEALWTALNDRSNWKLGYNPAFTAACERLRALERSADYPAPEYPANWERMTLEEQDAWLEQWVVQACRARAGESWRDQGDSHAS